MNIKGFEPMLRDATIKALDSVGQKVAGAAAKSENAITRLMNRWNALDQQEKENVASVVIATAITAVSAISAMRSGRQKKKGLKAAGKKVAKKLAG